MAIEHHILSNGVPVLIEPKLGDATLRYYYRAGSRHERKGESGVAHFLEHMVFRTPAYLKALKSGDKITCMNAFTSRNETTYELTGRVRNKQNIQLFNDVLMGMTASAAFSDEDVDLERQVVLRERSIAQNALSDMGYDNVYRVAFPGSAFGADILGSEEDIKNVTPEALHAYFQRYYHAGNLVVSVSGNIDSSILINDLEANISRFSQGDLREQKSEKYGGGAIHVPREESRQLNLTLAFQSVSEIDKRAPAVHVMAEILGGASALSNRLYDAACMKHGLTYGITSSNDAAMDHGLFEITTATGLDQGNELLSVIEREIDKLQQAPVTKDELRIAKRACRNIDTDTYNAGYLYTLFDRPVDVKELKDAYDAVTADDVLQVAHEIFSSVPSLSTVGAQGSQPDYDRFVSSLC